MNLMVLAGATGLAGTLAVVLAVWAVRSQLSCMAAMTASMALGMTVGLLAGVGAGTGLVPGLWPATLAGSVAGVVAGALAGATVSLMAVIDGTLSGLMGGMMGAMLGVMAPDQSRHLLVAGAGLLVVTASMLIVMIVQEVGADRFWPAVRRFVTGGGGRVGLFAVAVALAFVLGAVSA